MWEVIAWAAGVYVTIAIALAALLVGYVYVADMLYRRTLVRAFRDQLAQLPEIRRP